MDAWGIIFGAAVGFVSARLGERFVRLRNFRAEAAAQLALLLDCPDDDAVRVAYSDTRRTMLIACAKIRIDIWFDKRVRFDLAMADYCQLEKRERVA